ncbi:MAG: hypothetical protein JWM52_305 [Candidatus Saccharibacteria bacterium]|nr:hypothetical protein [Candidatus Saccharibacteria bacterium]
MNQLAILLLVTGSASVVAAIPQLIKLIKLKHSDEFSLVSWVVWCIYQVVSLIYAFYIHSLPYVFINALWVVFYFAMIILIIRYKSPKLVR